MDLFDGNNDKLKKEFEKNKKQFKDLKFDLKNQNDYMNWIVTLSGPKNTPYKGGKFKISLEFNFLYPIAPPKVVFLTKIYHPNIKLSTGEFSKDIYCQETEANLEVNEMLRAIKGMLEYVQIYNSVDDEILKQYQNNRQEFDKIASEYTQLYAK